jgi:hypothetical protein
MRKLSIFLLFVSLINYRFAFSQQTVTSASLSGTIEDASGARVPGATVTAHNHERNQKWTAQSEADGDFKFLLLPVGSYELKVEAQGFAPYIRQLSLTLGKTLDLPVKLQVAGEQESVEVIGLAPVVEAARTQLTETIIPQEIESLPLNGRNYLDLALLSPAVSRTNTGSNERFAETSAIPGTGISIAGQRNLNSGFVVDGLSANDDAADLAGTFFSQEVIREFQVVTSGGIAEFGRAAGGTINILTQSGANDWHGRLYGFLRNQRLDARNAFAAHKDPLTQTQYGVSLGGPITRDRGFLFSNFEQEHLNRAALITISPANVASINNALNRFGYKPERVVTGEYTTGYDRTNFFAKTDYNLTALNRLSARYSLYDISSPNARSVGGLNTTSRGTVLEDRDQTIAISDVDAISTNAVNEARFQYTRSNLSAPGNDLVGPAVSISGVANFGASTSSPTGRITDMLEVSNSFSRQSGTHYWKAGVDFLYNRIDIQFPGTLYGSYSFSSLPNFLTGTYTTFQQGFGNVDWFQTNPNFGWFVQDEWKPKHGLTINAGLRHDVQWLAASIQTRGMNFSPRIGIAYAPGAHKTVVRAGFGLYYDRIPLRAVANALRGAGLGYKVVSLQRTQVGAPVFPDKLASFPSNVLINLATIDPQIKNEYSVQANLQVERDLGHGTSVSMGYIHTRGTHIIMQRNLNVPSCTATQDPANLCRPNSSFGNITQYSGQGDSYYNGMTLSVQNHTASWTTLRFAYTFSKTLDNAGNAFFNSPQNNFNLRDDRGLSDNDQRNRLTVSGQFSAPKTDSNNLTAKIVRGFQLSTIFTYSSPYPFNILTGAQTIQTTSARPAGVGKNTGKGFNFAALDLRLSRNFRFTERIGMEILAETFNTLNRTNLQFPNNVFGTGTVPLPTFGKPTAANDPRQIQFGLRVNF